ncbi:NUMOD4 motif-containing HNH endonuclease [Synechocystis sp. LKSZ1]|uniref:NUMOD4 motif-containing HNH endonuclease n=1 Tax=Synechocystis sp. LKSZ1 TaxID=3144951 RepID=UPI00336BE81C
MTQPNWKPIPGYEGLYEASDTGQIRSKKGELSQKIWRGYPKVVLVKDGDRKNWRVHNLIALTFIGSRPDGYELDHIDANKLNNHITNLEYVTHQENVKRAAQKGLRTRTKLQSSLAWASAIVQGFLLPQEPR